MTQKLTEAEARQLYRDADKMTVSEIRATAMKHGLGAWLASAKRRTIVTGFRDRLERKIRDMHEPAESGLDFDEDES